AANVALPDAALLAADNRVRSVSLDAPMTDQTAAQGVDLLGQRSVNSQGRTSTSPPDTQSLRGTLGLNSTWDGAGVTVALIDSRLEMSADVEGRVKAFYDFTQGGVAGPTFDDYGHGTHIAGLIGGAGKLADGVARMGVAPKVNFVVLKVLGANGSGNTSDV